MLLCFPPCWPGLLACHPREAVAYLGSLPTAAGLCRIESMNSVMDDNRLLTLPSNERIRVLPHMKLIFEIRDLKFATPATATRAGILYISEGQQWNNMVQSWIQKVVR